MTKTEKALLRRGIRPTETRLEIYKYLKRKNYAVSQIDIQKDFLKKSPDNKTANKTTFYRNLTIFQEKGLIHQIDDGTGYVKYATTVQNENTGADLDLHLHFHCTGCGKTFCLQERMPETSMPSEHRVDGSNLVLRGLCKSCL